jgi:hypothetical protein
VPKKRVPPVISAYFSTLGKKGGSKGGKIGGKRSLETMTPEERTARAKKAAAASAKARRMKAKRGTKGK